MSEFPIRVLIADDHTLVREGLRLLFETDGDFSVLGEAADGLEAVRLAEDLQPQVILMDLRMPHMDGLQAVEEIASRWPAMAVVILTTYDEPEMMVRSLRAGAKGFLLKDCGRTSLFAAVRAAARGECLLGPTVLPHLMAAPQSSERGKVSSDPATLSDRELEVLRAVAKGERNRAIALSLGISERTIKAHLTSIFNKLGVDSRAAAVLVAIQLGLPLD